MARRQPALALRHMRTLFDVGAIGGLTDRLLLDQFTTAHREAAEAAFTTLVERHGPMVLRVCRGVLGDSHDVHDAFQATFLVLVRKSGSLWVRDSIGPWLHGVAFRVATKAKVAAARRKAHERRAAETAEANRGDGRDDLASMLHEEVNRLPPKHREPIVLCYLEGLTHEGAATALGWPVGTVSGRLARARELKLVALGRRRGEAWRKDVALVVVAIDNDREELRRYVQQNGLTTVQHLWSPEDKSEKTATAHAAYSISGVPTAFLIGRDGRIVWRGHPASLDLEAKIEAMLRRGR